MKQDDLPFPIGTTYFDGQTADTTTKEALNLEGKEYLTEDLNYSNPTFSSTKTLRTAYLKKVRIMRNVSGVTLAPGYLCQPQAGGTDGRFFLGRADGYARIGGAIPTATYPAYGIDEFLPTTGVLANDLFYATIEGPFLGIVAATAANLLTDSSTGTGRPIGVGDVLVADTAAASTFGITQLSTMTCGKIAGLTIGGVTGQTLGYNLLNRIGRALSRDHHGQHDRAIVAHVLHQNVRKWPNATAVFVRDGGGRGLASGWCNGNTSAP